MCGISGFFGKKPLEEGRIQATLHLMRNRGPDHQAYRQIHDAGISVALLHSRLSIIDLDPRAHQPFTLEDCTLVFNGEIYNYLELREALQKKLIACKTTSDMEVLLRYYLLYGESCVDHFEGMWSFALYDRRIHRLFLSRDRFGEKPFYYFQTEEGFYFGSEIKLIRALSETPIPIHERHLWRYLAQGYKSLHKTPETFFQNVQELPPATNASLDPSLKMVARRYWSPQIQTRAMTFEDAVDGFRHHLLEAVRIRLRSDVPIAFCLSGGIDSSSIVSIASKIFGHEAATFSIVDRDERYHELPNIQATIEDLRCRPTLIHLSHDLDFLNRLKELVRYHDAPVSTVTFFVHSLLQEAIARQGYKVSVSGTGADELVTGYYDHFLLHLYEMRRHPAYPEYLKQWEDHVRPLVRNPYFKNPRLYLDDPDFRRHIFSPEEELKGWLQGEFDEPFTERTFCEGLLKNRMLNELFHETVPVALHEDDLNAMRCSVENRSPYLDSRLFQFSFSIPEEHLIRDGYAKFVLRSAVKGILNDRVRLDRCKKGFNAAVHSLLNFQDPSQRDWILDPSSRVYDFVPRRSMEDLMKKESFSDPLNKFFFSFLNVKIFLDEFDRAPAQTPLSALNPSRKLAVPQ